MELLSSNFIALDLEMNQPSNKIIQIGIAIGSIASTEFIVKKWYVDPSEPISPDITKLTGISDNDINHYAMTLSDISIELTSILIEHKPFINPVTWGGDDASLLRSTFLESGIPFHLFGRRHVDCKTLHFMTAVARGKSPHGGLYNAMKSYKLKFVGDQHRADVDAMNTLTMFFHLMERQQALEGKL